MKRANNRQRKCEIQVRGRREREEIENTRKKKRNKNRKSWEEITKNDKKRKLERKRK